MIPSIIFMQLPNKDNVEEIKGNLFCHMEFMETFLRIDTWTAIFYNEDDHCKADQKEIATCAIYL